MADRASAMIQIGGTISGDLIPALLEAIECDGGKADWEGNAIELSHIAAGHILEVCAYELVGGQFECVEAFCRTHGIAFVRRSDACSGAFGPERAVHTGDGAPRYYEVNDFGRIVLTQRELNDLGSIAAANAWFEAGDFALPLLSIGTRANPSSGQENDDG
ncbi:hypothetical protein [Sphingopyxis sp.]|uniref:hypothetical protein n=1 Tax=Sphingopyxis sp. TaxID=1908224 RepID=UPI002D776CFE|nr:hypothetical protein [Sphingopyxis sp.]HET6525035.1 hypothetical protein [Sphingopyxis sp.]